MIDGIHAATTPEQPAATTVSQFNGIPVHPGEDAAAKQDEDWWRIFNSVLSNTDAIYFIAKKVPHPLGSRRFHDRTNRGGGDSTHSITHRVRVHVG
eukprot:7348767-Prymnesium_polylepis.1